MIEQVLPYTLHLAIVNSNLPAVWENMLNRKIIPSGSVAPDDADEVLKILYENICIKDAADTTLLLSHVLDVPPLNSDSEAAKELMKYKLSITSGDLILTNTIRNNEADFKLINPKEQSITGFFVVLGIGFMFYLGYRLVKKLLK